MNHVDISRLSAEELWTRLLELAKIERGATCDLVETLAETDRRGLYKDHSYVSLFECCVHKLGFSEAAAYRRIRAARSLKLFPPIGPLLRQGRLTLESIALLHPFLKEPDAAALVSAAAGKRVWEVERLVASRRTEEPRRDVVRFIAPSSAAPATVPAPRESSLFELPAAASAPTPPATEDSPIEPPAAASTPPGEGCPSIAAPTAGSPAPAPPSPAPPPPTSPPPAYPSPALPPPTPAPAPPHAVRIAFTADESFFRLMTEAQAAMRHKYPNGRLDGVFRDALEALLRKKRPWAFPRRAAK